VKSFPMAGYQISSTIYPHEETKQSLFMKTILNHINLVLGSLATWT